jgi:hypothetical protein
MNLTRRQVTLDVGFDRIMVQFKINRELKLRELTW